MTIPFDRDLVVAGVIWLNPEFAMKPETDENDRIPVWMWCAVAVFTIVVFATGYWRFGTVWMGLVAVLAEIAIGATLFALGAIPK